MSAWKRESCGASVAMVAGVAVVAALSVVTSSAITPGDPFTLSPGQGAPFTVVTASGANCPPAGANVLVELEDLTGDEMPGGTGGIRGAFVGFFTSPDASGNWSGSFTIPPVVPAGQYRVTARCTITDAYAPQPFEVLAGDLASISVTPTRATAGTDVAVTVSGTLCRGEGAEVDVRIEFGGGEETAGRDPVARVLVTPDSAGSWSTQVIIPAATPAGRFLVGVQCFVGNQQFFIYSPPPTFDLEAPERVVVVTPRLTG